MLALEGEKPAIWINPGLSTEGIHPSAVVGQDGGNAGDKTATDGTIFTLDSATADATDIALDDINNDEHTDLVLAYGTGFEVILAPADGSSVGAWPAAKKVAASAKYVKVADMDNDGHPDIVVAGTEVKIYFGSDDATLTGDYSTADVEVKVVGSGSGFGVVLALDVADIDGDGWMDVAVTYESTYKRCYFGRRGADSRDQWPSAEAKRFGPASQDERTLTSLELVRQLVDSATAGWRRSYRPLLPT